MLTILDAVERELPALLDDPDGWQSLLIDYHPPRVERLWRPLGEHRVSLHRIHPCAPEEALFHPHPWPSAMRVLTGVYEMDVGWGRGSVAPPVAARLRLTPGCAYAMTDPDGWHSVRPLDAPTLSVMVTGRPWGRASPTSAEPLRPLDGAAARALLADVRALYPARSMRDA